MSYVSDRPTPSTPAAASDQPVDRSTGSISPLTHSIETSADALIDDVFADIERMIERGVALFAPEADDDADFFERLDLAHFNDEPDETDSIFSPEDLEPSPSESLAVLPKVSPRELTMGEAEVDADVLLDLAKESQVPAEKRQSVDGLLASLIAATLLITGGIWLYLRQQTPQVSAPIAEEPSPAEVLAAQRDADFLDYVRRSVERIERSKKQADALAGGSPQTSPTVLERIYIPFNQPPSVAESPGTSLPIPSPAPAPVIPSTPPSITAQPPAPVPTPVPAPSVAVIPNIAPSPSHVLIGLLELGDRSAALFEIEGTPHRIQVGERIGSSGWALVSISNQEAIIRRNGEVRSIYIGQQF
ncbi:hypothetical protein [Egbenema bharatensis]|uniref:hypothetical protein n=1 Tax=Egbenema bharatensis TaxID=3463334 RepID=UPI003A842F56